MQHTEKYIPGKVILPALIVGAAAAVVLGILIPMAGLQLVLEAYLFGFLFWSGLSIGALSALLLHQVVAGHWGFMIQRICEAAARLMPLVALLFIPIALGMHYLYPWTSAEYLAKHDIVASKVPYLNETGFIVRAVVIFAVWIIFAFLLNRWSRQLDDSGKRSYVKWMARTSTVGLVLYVLTMTVAHVDWSMSLVPEWFSSIYGGIWIVNYALTLLAFAIFVLTRLYKHDEYSPYIRIDYFHHLGNLLLGFTVLWAYMNFSQYLLIWSANLPEEIPWYLVREQDLYQIISIVLIVFHFAVPFFILLIRRSKRSVPFLAGLCVFIFIMRIVDHIWMIVPNYFPENVLGHILADMLAWVAFGGLFLAAWGWQLNRRPIMPRNDPRLRSGEEHHDPSGVNVTIRESEAVKHA